jgi:Ca2+-binding EF-hand superfamily protein
MRMVSNKRGDSHPPSPTKSISSSQSIPTISSSSSSAPRVALTLNSNSNHGPGVTLNSNSNHGPGGDYPQMTRAKASRRASTGMDGLNGFSTMMRGGGDEIPATSGNRYALNNGNSNNNTGDSRMTRAKTNRHASLDGAAMSPMKGGGADDSKKANNRPVISPFLRTTHKKLKEQVGKIQEQIRFIQNVALMKDNNKIETLFELIDGDGGGSVDAGELAKAMRRNDELSFSVSIEKAIDMVAKFDVNGDGELDKTEFQAYVKAMVQELKLSCSEFCELIIVQLLLGDDDGAMDGCAVDKENISEEVKKRKTLYNFISKNKEDLEELFDLFKAKKAAEQVKFADVAQAIANCDIIKNASKRLGIADSLEVLLMTSSKDKRMLDFKQFGRLALSVVKTSRTSFVEVAESLFDSVKGVSTWDNDNHDQSTVGSFTTGIDELTNNRLKRLFHLWDADGDGDISKEELSNGLSYFQSATGMKVDTDAIARALISFDTGGDNQLDPREFSEAMFQYAKISGVELNVLIDFMCITSSIEQQSNSATHFPEFKDEDFEETGFDEYWE